MLVFGHRGQVATALREAVVPAGWTVRTVGRDHVDIVDRAAVAAMVRESGATLVINAAAYTAVDRAESEPDLAFAVNRDGAAHVAEACAAAGVPLIHLSTDYVFDGKSAGHAYRETDPINPLSCYGVSKAAGEQAVRAATDHHAIVRTSWVYGPHGHNFVRTMLSVGEERPEMGIVDDQTGCPTSAADIADALVTMALRILTEPAPAEAGLFGTFHFTGSTRMTWYGLASAVFSLAARHGRGTPGLRPIASLDYPTPAVRPLNSVLDCSRLLSVYGIASPPWRHSLELCIDRLCEAKMEVAA
ncbi:dTDP-4-dehydrorhamnose reductase [Skermanella stibiiresistens SB22]|uniref:dTDP-4-dehydrorhamnose reductase n=1 Tax=Skermanella stibiiresistens SB22 TaxID=1385369 RepID=W9H9I0_9PROT|nr:dTDP-4-dehydrorhamnose reductase [Skermanella stibiiresistens SB22]